MKKIYYGHHNINEQDINSVVDALNSDWLTNGPKVAQFENEFAEFIGSKHAIAVSSGTAALHLAALSMRKIYGDNQGVVLTSPLTFIASVSAFIHAGYNIDLVDIDNETLNIDLNLLERKLKTETKKRVVGIVPVHFAGLPVDMDSISYLANKYGAWVIEDAAHALGGEAVSNENQIYKCGQCRFSQATTFSFHPVKHITTCEGGMVTTNDSDISKIILMLRSHSIDRSKSINDWEYDIETLGYNYRLTEIQSALGLSQLSRIEEFIQKRRDIASKYNHAFCNLPITIPKEFSRQKHSYHLYTIRTKKRDELFAFLKSKDIVGQIHYIPLYNFTVFKSNGFIKNNFPVTEKYYEECITLPLNPKLTDEEQQRVISSMEIFFSNF